MIISVPEIVLHAVFPCTMVMPAPDHLVQRLKAFLLFFQAAIFSKPSSISFMIMTMMMMTINPEHGSDSAASQIRWAGTEPVTRAGESGSKRDVLHDPYSDAL